MYDAFSTDYDRFVDWDSRLAAELPFLEDQIRLAAPGIQNLRILDAACGTGMHAIALAKKGYETAGADSSRGMIERARENAQKAQVSTRFETAGFGQLSNLFGTGQFQAVLCLGNSLPHLVTRENLVEALVDFSDCLSPGGVAIIQNRNFDLVLEQQRWMEPQTYQEGNREWLFLRSYDFEPGELLTFHVISLYREGKTAWQQSVRSTRMRALTFEKLDSVLADSGFEQVTYYGSIKGEPFDPGSSGNLIAVARKPSA
jgi:SAM-dependent methyltransferase